MTKATWLKACGKFPIWGFALIVLLGKQSNVVAERPQPLKHRARFSEPALQNKIIHEPEAAGEKRAFVWRQTVFRFTSVIAEDDSIHHNAARGGSWCPSWRHQYCLQQFRQLVLWVYTGPGRTRVSEANHVSLQAVMDRSAVVGERGTA